MLTREKVQEFRKKAKLTSQDYKAIEKANQEVLKVIEELGVGDDDKR